MSQPAKAALPADDPLVPSTAGDLAVTVEPVAPHTPCHHVYQRMYLDRRLHAVPVVDGLVPLGLVTRGRFFEAFCARDCRDVHGAHVIAEHLPSAPVIVDEGLSLVELADLLTEEAGRLLAEGFIVTRGGQYLGVGAGHHLLRALADVRHRERHVRTYRDSLTGLPNRHLFEDRLSVALAAADRARHKLAVLWIDLDEFGAVNDAHGRAVGDALLNEIGARLRKAVRRSDTVGRLGSDEFGVLLPVVDSSDAAQAVATKIMAEVAAPFRIGEASVPIECTAGVAVCPEDGSSVRRLMRCAEHAANHARDVRRSIESEEPGDQPGGQAPAVCSYGTLRRAIERRELALVYQPQIDVSTGRVCGVEALVRWPNAAGRTVSANEIIALADSSGLVVPFTEWVLSTACWQLRQWHESGLLILRMAINVSGAQVRQHALAGIVERTLEDTGLPSAALELELNEQVVMPRDAAIERALDALRQVGVRLSIDHFGAGSVSLARVARLPVDSLKLDRSTVAAIETSEQAVRLASAIIAMGHALGLEVIAGGVETEGQWRLLRARHCDVMQGHYFSRPMPPSQVASLFRDGRLGTTP